MRSVERCRTAQLPEPLRLLLHHDSFFGSPGFAELWESMGGTAVCWILTESGKVIAAMTGVEFRSRPFTRFQAMPDGCYSRLYVTEENEAEQLKARQELLARIWRAGYAKLFISDYFRQLGIESEAGDMVGETLVVDISSANWQPPDQKLQSEIRKAERERVEVLDFDAKKNFDGFMNLMTRTERRHVRSPKYSRAFFLDLAKLAKTDRRVRWLYVHRNGAPVVSHIYFVEHTMALNWQIYYDKEYSSLKANQYTMFTTARMLAESGVTHLNLGATPPEAESVKSYKEKWGGKAVSYPIIMRKSWLGRML